MLKPIVSLLLLASATVCAAQPVLTAAQYVQQLGVGMNVDWARTDRGIREFDPLVVRDYKAKGLTHVRIRVAGEPTEARLIHLRKLPIRLTSIKKTPVPVTKKRWLTGGWRWRITLAKARRCWVST